MRAVVAVVCAMAFLATTAALVALARQPPALTLPLGALALALAGAHYLLQRHALAFPFRGQSVAVFFDEIVIFVGLLTLPAFTLPFVLLPAEAVAQVMRRRSLVKSVYNIASQLLSGSIGVLLFAGLAPAMHPVFAAALVIVWHTVVSNFLVALVVARIERTSPWSAFRERFSFETPFQAVVGTSVGLVLVALWSYHPLALLAAVPFYVLLAHFTRHRARAERVLLVHDRVTRFSQAVGRLRDREGVADELLKTVGELFPVSRATLVIVGRGGHSHGVWTRSFPREPREWAKLETALMGSDGFMLGTLTVDIDQNPFQADAASAPVMLRMLAQEASIAFERAESAPSPRALKV